MKRPKRKKRECKQNCFYCGKCTYIGEGDYICEDSTEVVIGDWQPTENFYSCKGKGYEKL